MLNKLNRAMQRLQRGEKGITGLETAIILIAFVTVASVLGYAVLSAGIFSAEKGKETVYQGLAQAQASMEVKGSVYALVDTTATPPKVTDITFDIASVLNDQAVDMTPPDGVGGGKTNANTTVISYTDSTGTYNDVSWTETPLGVNTGDTSGMLKPNEQMEIDVTLPTTGPGTGGSGADLGTYGTFTIQVVPATGAAITIERTLPGLLGTTVDLN
jgi:flagellin FlaB